MAPSWTCSAGSIHGFESAGVYRATGIRYARAGRYELPTEEAPASQPIDATKPCKACIQAPDLFGQAINLDVLESLEQSEDCLQLSVTTPTDAALSKALPVLVWIHGGSYTNGAGDSTHYNPTVFVKEQQCIVVNINYRLGMLGYLGGSDDTRPANLGLLDQIEALRWVQRNIEAFGGARDNVTVFGQSAGADAAAHLMVAHGTKGLFRRVILQSAPLGISGTGRAAMYAAMGEAAKNLPNNASPSELAAMQEQVLKVAKRTKDKSYMPFGVRYGAHPMPAEDELDAAYKSAAASIDVLVGFNQREVAVFLNVLPPLNKLANLPIISTGLEYSVIRPLTRKIYSDFIPAFKSRHQAGGGRIYSYLFDLPIPNRLFSSTHCSELPFLFEMSEWKDSQFTAGLSKTEVTTTGSQLRSLWATFAKTGNLDLSNVPKFLKIQS